MLVLCHFSHKKTNTGSTDSWIMVDSEDIYTLRKDFQKEIETRNKKWDALMATKDAGQVISWSRYDDVTFIRGIPENKEEFLKIKH